MADELRLTALMGVVGVPVLALLVVGGRRTDGQAVGQPRLRRQLATGFGVVGVFMLVASFLVMGSDSYGGGPTLFWSGATFIAIAYLNHRRTTAR